MRLCLVWLFTALCVCAQSQPVFRGVPPAAEQRSRPGGHGARGNPGWRSPWWVWPGGWAAEGTRKPLPPPVETPKPMDLLIWNPHYEPPRPVSVPPPLERGDVPLPVVPAATATMPCRLREASGREFDAEACQVSDDMVRWRSGDGRWRRATLDLVAPVR